jgi:hypothetical protein
MTWTTPADLRAQVQKLWDKGELLRPCVQGDALPPRRLRLSGPSSTELSERFDDVRAWMAALGCNAPVGAAPRWRIVPREFRHRVLGACAVPDGIWLDTLDDALALLGKHQEAKRFVGLVQTTREQQPVLLPWLEKRPLQALALAQEWPRLLAVVAWLQVHPRPGIYLRQVDVPGVDSKFIEAHRGVLAELLDVALPPEAIDTRATGVGQFGPRYGFKDKPLRVRFRLLDARICTGLLPADAEHDITLTQADFARLALPVRRVFFTENEVNFLAFPPLAGSLVIFGAGYGFEALADARWLHGCRLFYWGDIDTHGFAILDQLRARLPQVQSLLMDRATLMAHPAQWGEEPQPQQRDLTRLTVDEAALLDDLRTHRLRPHREGAGVRLEQERVGFEWVKAALAATERE